SKHPITKLMEQVIEIIIPLGYSIQTGPYVESDWYNFSALNFPPFHPSRDLQDTFYIGKDHVLRTHTSPVQIRALESLTPPFAVLAPGAVFRSDSDISHSPMFHQVEGLYVNQKVSLADLKGTLSYFLKKLFQSSQIQLRFRPSFFPFTEPSAEYDISCPFCSMKGCSVCKKSGWIEIGGCGLVHPEVFHSVKWDSSHWQGFAFGLGVERLAVILYNIPDIRLFFESDVRFLKQFSAV
ncbi:MAG: phenylalanine--tRNA ligase subunit alpha, partial [Oligoflexia bacterium]|nr:phenylalanine--tRNA ligase subunit alpha [Oligoflexia bacterium]